MNTWISFRFSTARSGLIICALMESSCLLWKCLVSYEASHYAVIGLIFTIMLSKKKSHPSIIAINFNELLSLAMFFLTTLSELIAECFSCSYIFSKASINSSPIDCFRRDKCLIFCWTGIFFGNKQYNNSMICSRSGVSFIINLRGVVLTITYL